MADRLGTLHEKMLRHAGEGLENILPEDIAEGLLENPDDFPLGHPMLQTILSRFLELNEAEKRRNWRKRPANRPRDGIGQEAEFVFSKLHKFVDAGKLSEKRAQALTINYVSMRTEKSKGAVREAWRRERERHRAHTRK